MTASPVASLPIAQLADVPDMNANAVALTNSLDHIVVPKYATTGARDSANASPIQGDLCYITGRGYMYYNSAATWTDFEDAITAFRTSTLAIATTKTSYCATPSLPVGTYKFSAAIGINNTSSVSLTAELDFGGTSTVTYAVSLWNASGAASFASTVGVTSFASPTGSSSTAHMYWYFDGIMVVSVAGALSLQATATSTAKTADGGGYIRVERWA